MRLPTICQRRVLKALGTEPIMLVEVIRKTGDSYPDKKLSALEKRNLVERTTVYKEGHKRTWQGWKLTEEGVKVAAEL